MALWANKAEGNDEHGSTDVTGSYFMLLVVKASSRGTGLSRARCLAGQYFQHQHRLAGHDLSRAKVEPPQSPATRPTSATDPVSSPCVESQGQFQLFSSAIDSLHCLAPVSSKIMVCVFKVRSSRT
jgi:hypothetical protein